MTSFDNIRGTHACLSKIMQEVPSCLVSQKSIMLVIVLLSGQAAQTYLSVILNSEREGIFRLAVLILLFSSALSLGRDLSYYLEVVPFLVFGNILFLY